MLRSPLSSSLKMLHSRGRLSFRHEIEPLGEFLRGVEPRAERRRLDDEVAPPVGGHARRRHRRPAARRTASARAGDSRPPPRPRRPRAPPPRPRRARETTRRSRGRTTRRRAREARRRLRARDARQRRAPTRGHTLDERGEVRGVVPRRSRRRRRFFGVMKGPGVRRVFGMRTHRVRSAAAPRGGGGARGGGGGGARQPRARVGRGPDPVADAGGKRRECAGRSLRETG